MIEYLSESRRFLPRLVSQEVEGKGDCVPNEHDDHDERQRDIRHHRHSAKSELSDCQEIKSLNLSIITVN
jgi:hypothetical protein